MVILPTPWLSFCCLPLLCQWVEFENRICEWIILTSFVNWITGSQILKLNVSLTLKKRISYGFGTTWEWVHNYIIFICMNSSFYGMDVSVLSFSFFLISIAAIFHGLLFYVDSWLFMSIFFSVPVSCQWSQVILCSTVTTFQSYLVTCLVRWKRKQSQDKYRGRS